MAADQHQILHLAQADGICLPEGMAAGGQINGMHRPGGLVAHRFPAAVQGICRHHRAATAAVGIVVHLILLVGGIVPDLMGFDTDEAPFLCPAQNTLAEHIPQCLGKEGQNINPHRCASPQ